MATSASDDRLSPTKAANVMKEIEDYFHRIINLSEREVQSDMEIFQKAAFGWNRVWETHYSAYQASSSAHRGHQLEEQANTATQQECWCWAKYQRHGEGFVTGNSMVEKPINGHRQLIRLLREMVHTALFEYFKDPDSIWYDDNGERVYGGVESLLERLWE